MEQKKTQSRKSFKFRYISKLYIHDEFKFYDKKTYWMKILLINWVPHDLVPHQRVEVDTLLEGEGGHEGPTEGK